MHQSRQPPDRQMSSNDKDPASHYFTLVLYRATGLALNTDSYRRALNKFNLNKYYPLVGKIKPDVAPSVFSLLFPCSCRPISPSIIRHYIRPPQTSIFQTLSRELPVFYPILRHFYLVPSGMGLRWSLYEPPTSTLESSLTMRRCQLGIISFPNQPPAPSLARHTRGPNTAGQGVKYPPYTASS
ncbi:hypothetical protein BT67DRAFT_58442 [Trichocladium antarcticum]|uniref:Uncharacterized protein n=1 Tax=Trichocladium antarcticum TaxID=1450529 RepID=A0AAN6UHL3_9PEZI|nr:hypothetical protein BT67DRAFT_58442 [Trichocladium antarcticum]